MRNLYLETNFRDSRSDYSDCEKIDLTRSNSMYDENVLITHGFITETLPDGSIMKRLVSDVEIAMSTSDSIKAVVSDEYQQQMRLGLLNQPRNPSRVGNVSDDDLIDEMIPVSAEPDEVAEFARYNLSEIQSRPQPPVGDSTDEQTTPLPPNSSSSSE